ncbi:MAG: POTRA domain-containing protein [Candidatus Acidiferrales bacterium]
MIFAALFPHTARARDKAQAGTSRLAAIEVTGSSRFRSEQIAAATGLRAGADVTTDDLQKTANDLAQLGPFSKVEYRYASTDAGVRVEYQVTDAPEVPVWFDNFPWFTDEELNAAIKNSIPLFDGAAPEHGTLLDAMSSALGALLSTRGVNARVSHALVTAAVTGQQVQQFHVEDTSVKIAAIEFGDALARSERGIQMRLSDLVGQPFSRTAIELFEFEQVRPVYLSHGFLRVRFGAPSARMSGGSVTVAAPVDPGPNFTWSGVTWKGNSAIGVLELGTLVPFREGDPADGTKIEGVWETVRKAYMRLGYLDISLNPTPQFDEAAHRAGYSVSVTEGPQYHMGKLVLTGLSIDGERRIRAAWKIPPGAVFDAGVYDEFLENGVKQAFAGFPFHYEKIGRFLQQDPKTATVDVLLDFQ